MSSLQIMVGNYVRLKLGGPPMKVVAINDMTGMLDCRWKDEHGMLIAKEFHKSSVRLARRPKK